MLEHGLVDATPPERIVVVGGRGFVGGAIARRAAAAGATVSVIGSAEVDLLSDGAGDALTAHMRASDAVIYASAIAPVKNSAMLIDNIRLIDALAAATRAARPSYILNIGSDAVFADSDAPLSENSCRAPASLHGVMHLLRENTFGEAALEIGAPIAHLRPTLVYGVDDPHNGYGPNRFRRLAAAGDTITLFGEGEERRDHVWVEDVAELAVRMIFRRSTGALNAATGTVISFRELAEHIAANATPPVAVVGSPRSGPMPHNGYRPFNPGATRAAFPDFKYTPPLDGVDRVQAELASRGD